MDEGRLYSVDEIFEKLRIPYRYLRKLMTKLTKSDFVISIQGKNGGYKISRKPENISLLDIISIVEPGYLSGKCFFGFDDCALQPACTMHDRWDSVKSHIRGILANTSLADIKKGNNQNQILTNISHSL